MHLSTGVGTGFLETSVSTAIWSVSMEEEAAIWTATFTLHATAQLATQVKTLLYLIQSKLRSSCTCTCTCTAFT